MYSRVNKNLGFSTNVSLDPSSNSQSSQQITNNIIVKTNSDEPAVVERSIELNEPAETNNVIINNVETNDNVEKILLEIYKSILLSQNKQLLSNILSKRHIMIYKDDLERVISAKINRKCSVVLKEIDGCGCAAKIDPFAIIDAIVVYENDKRVDFKVAYNSDFVELSEKYGLSLKICLV